MRQLFTITLITLALTASLASGLVQDGEGPFDSPIGDDTSAFSESVLATWI